MIIKNAGPDGVNLFPGSCENVSGMLPIQAEFPALQIITRQKEPSGWMALNCNHFTYFNIAYSQNIY